MAKPNSLFRDYGYTQELGKLLTVAYWEDLLNSVLKVFPMINTIILVDPDAPVKDYPFDRFPTDEVFPPLGSSKIFLRKL